MDIKGCVTSHRPRSSGGPRRCERHRGLAGSPPRCQCSTAPSRVRPRPGRRTVPFRKVPSDEAHPGPTAVPVRAVRSSARLSPPCQSIAADGALPLGSWLTGIRETSRCSSCAGGGTVIPRYIACQRYVSQLPRFDVSLSMVAFGSPSPSLLLSDRRKTDRRPAGGVGRATTRRRGRQKQRRAITAQRPERSCAARPANHRPS